PDCTAAARPAVSEPLRGPRNAEGPGTNPGPCRPHAGTCHVQTVVRSLLLVACGKFGQRPRRQVEKAADPQSVIPGSNPGGASTQPMFALTGLSACATLFIRLRVGSETNRSNGGASRAGLEHHLCGARRGGVRAPPLHV